MIEVKAPNTPVMSGVYRHSIFLAGSIEMGVAEQWQQRVAEGLKDVPHLIVYNPRRDDWDSSWEQTIENEQFNEQVMWELHHLKKADVIPMYFSPETKSPITLLELGLFADSGKLIVCCPEGFWRKGNVDIVCRQWGIDQVDSIEELIETTKTRLAHN